MDRTTNSTGRISCNEKPCLCIVVGVNVERSGRSHPTREYSDAFEALFTAERRPMVHLAVLMVDSREVAEEVVQEAFASVADRWSEIDRHGAYLRTSVVNGCRMVLRRRATSRRLDPPRSVLPVDAPTDLVELRDALSTLPDRQRVVLILRYFQDLPDMEIAEVVGCRPSTVRLLAARGLHTMRKALT